MIINCVIGIPVPVDFVVLNILQVAIIMIVNRIIINFMINVLASFVIVLLLVEFILIVVVIVVVGSIITLVVCSEPIFPLYAS